MELSTIAIIYVYGWAVVTIALLEKPTLKDLLVSAILALAWPVHIPSVLLNRLIR